MPAHTSAMIREVTPSDYGRWIDIVNASYPDYGWTVEEMRHDDEGWDHATFFRRRLVAEADGVVVGAAETGHWPNRFNADNYNVDVVVDPGHRRRGHGRALYAELETTLRGRGARMLRCGVKESMSDRVAFAREHGYPHDVLADDGRPRPGRRLAPADPRRARPRGRRARLARDVRRSVAVAEAFAGRDDELHGAIPEHRYRGLGPRCGRPFEVEHGDSTHDEINILVAGANHGYPVCRGPCGDPRFVDPAWSSGNVTTATSGADFARGPQWGAWDGSLYITTSNGTGDRIVRITPG